MLPGCRKTSRISLRQALNARAKRGMANQHGSVMWLLATVVVAAVISRAAAQEPLPDRVTGVETGTAAIAGHVLDAASGEPVRKAAVRVAGPLPLLTYRAVTTDGDGRYAVKKLPAGRYNVLAAKPTYVNATVAGDSSRLVQISDGDNLSNVDLKLSRGGVIAGRVTDEHGNPIAGVDVSITRLQFLNRARRLLQVAKRDTNDLGEFRLFGISPGQYYLSATLGRSRLPPHAASEGLPAPMYYPASPNIAEAQRLTIDPGQVLSGVDMVLRPVHGVRISGTVVDSSGLPVNGGRVILSRLMEDSSLVTASPIGPAGIFVFDNVVPGELVLRSSKTDATTAEHAVTRLTVGDDDLADVALTMTKASTVSGRIVVDQASSGAIRPADVRLNAAPAYPELSPVPAGATSAAIHDDFSFRLETWPGRVLLGSGGTVPGWSIKSVRLGGVDVTETGFDLGADGVRNVEVELTDVVSEISGLVVTRDGQPTRGACAVVFSQDAEKWPVIGRGANGSCPDLAGRYRVRPLRPGAYYIVAVSSSAFETGEWSDPEFLNSVRDRSLSFTIEPGEQKALDLPFMAVER